MNISEQLRQLAIENGVCDKFLNGWSGNESMDELIDKYWKGMDFCIDKNFPPVEFIRSNMKGSIEKYGIFIDGSFNVTDMKSIALYEGADGTSSYQSFSTGDIYMFNGSRLNLIVGEHAFVYISMWPGSILNIISKHKSSRIGISYWGGEITGDTYNINIHHKNNK